MKFYLATMTHNRYTPAYNHGLIELDDAGIIQSEPNVGVPIEDMGMYILRQKPFPTDQKQLDKLFFKLLKSY